MKMLIADDNGNSTTKMIVNESLIKQPTMVRRIYSAPTVADGTINEAVSTLMDRLLLDISSPAVRRNGLYMIGQRAKSSSTQAEAMNIHVGRKADSDIPLITTLGMTAAKAVQDRFFQTLQFPDTITAEAYMTGAIPASEYTTKIARSLEDKYMKVPHIVTVHVLDKIVTVKNIFRQVKITQEGIPALYALLEADAGILKNYKGEETSPRDFKNKRALHVDIGDGTTEYIYTEGVNPVPDQCSGARRGVGHATEEAIKMLSDLTNGYVKLTRQQYMDVLSDPDNNYYAEAKGYFAETLLAQADKIQQDVEEKFMELSASVDYIVVYGGGSIAFYDTLYERLQTFAENANTKLLWVPAEYAVDMNVKGMDSLNKHLFYKDVAKNIAVSA
ncbi:MULTISPECIES: ParM/StbA family protein [unclassified Sporolactobacillus]|uniref:ParM/StbA family protein n=1 Tax=unclassified Sporolactobacillus TaxID=2628533 RepID=UPI00236827D8|nr:ParM/StbA family protein [Sporolactobacillus sp. CQH2019]MDD9150428.1 ParM/StbA family protein [Sporolactobacillus sp. CQH2019]